MLICGDIHGNYQKAKAFLEYKPELQHCFVGDYTDAWTAPDSEIIKTMEMIFESDAVVLAGNHDNQYFRSAGMFTRCTGYRHNSAMMFTGLIEKYKDKIKASCIADDFIVVHGGITREFGRNFDTIQEIDEYCNKEFDKFKNSPVVESSHSNIFNIASIRGGKDKYGGIFWATYGFEKFDTRFNIACGHTFKQDPRHQEHKHGKVHVCVDCQVFTCFNTETARFEDFMFENIKHNFHERALIEKNF